MNKDWKDMDDSEILSQLRDMFDTAKAHYALDQERIRILDLTDNGKLWQALEAKLPPYQICPDTNFISYIKNNIVASVYTVAKSAEVIPTSDQDKTMCMHINCALDNLWQTQHVGEYQFEAGDWAALCNLGITQVGWDENLILDPAEKHFVKGSVVFKNVDPIKFMRDPFAKDLDSAAYCMTYDVYHKSAFLRNPNYHDAFAEYTARDNGYRTPFTIPALRDSIPSGAAKNYYTLITFWVKNDEGGINEYHTCNLETILYKKENIKPDAFPFALLYCNTPKGGRVIGTSEPARIFANNAAYNIFDSIALTAEYRNQRPPKYVSAQANINVNSFAKHGDDPDRTFVVNGDASKAVHYHEYPQVSNLLPQSQMRTADAIKMITGIDDRYTGRDTGSIITTGGTEEMLNRVTVIDTPKILNYEKYTARLTELALKNMIAFSAKRKYLVPDERNVNKYREIEVDFPQIPNDTLFQYQIMISSELPKNKQRVAALATAILEKQMQYGNQGTQIDLITPEEWLEMQDLPNKERFMERMGIQRNTNMVEQVSETLFGYADLVKQGMQPDQAIIALAKRMQDAQSGKAPIEEGPMPEGVPSEDPAMMMDANMQI